jgi:hypothetical protein
MSNVNDLLTPLVPTTDEVFAFLKTGTGLIEDQRIGAVMRLGLAIAKSALESEDQPKAYLEGLLDQLELNAQKRAHERFG